MTLLRVAFGALLLAMMAAWIATSGIQREDNMQETLARDAALASGASVVELRQPFRTSFRYRPRGCDDTALVTLQSIMTNPYTLLPEDPALSITTYYFESGGKWPGRVNLLSIWLRERFGILLGQRQTLPTNRMIIVHMPHECIDTTPVPWRMAFR